MFGQNVLTLFNFVKNSYEKSVVFPKGTNWVSLTTFETYIGGKDLHKFDTFSELPML